MDEDAPNYRSIIQNPMDMATLLQCVDCGQYITCAAFLQDFDLIVNNAKVYTHSMVVAFSCFLSFRFYKSLRCELDSHCKQCRGMLKGYGCWHLFKQQTIYAHLLS